MLNVIQSLLSLFFSSYFLSSYGFLFSQIYLEGGPWKCFLKINGPYLTKVWEPMLSTLETVSKINFSLFQQRDNVSSGSSVNNSNATLSTVCSARQDVLWLLLCSECKKQKTVLLTLWISSYLAGINRRLLHVCRHRWCFVVTQLVFWKFQNWLISGTAQIELWL